MNKNKLFYRFSVVVVALLMIFTSIKNTVPAQNLTSSDQTNSMPEVVTRMNDYVQTRQQQFEKYKNMTSKDSELKLIQIENDLSDATTLINLSKISVDDYATDNLNEEKFNRAKSDLEKAVENLTQMNTRHSEELHSLILKSFLEPYTLALQEVYSLLGEYNSQLTEQKSITKFSDEADAFITQLKISQTLSDFVRLESKFEQLLNSLETERTEVRNKLAGKD